MTNQLIGAIARLARSNYARTLLWIVGITFFGSCIVTHAAGGGGASSTDVSLIPRGSTTIVTEPTSTRNCIVTQQFSNVPPNIPATIQYKLASLKNKQTTGDQVLAITKVKHSILETQVEFTGPAGWICDIQSTQNLCNTSAWTRVGAAIIVDTGSVVFVDSRSSIPQFYRVAKPAESRAAILAVNNLLLGDGL